MLKFTKCDICPMYPFNYNKESLNIPFLKPMIEKMYPLDFKFIVRNWMYYDAKLLITPPGTAEMKHIKKQLERILWIVKQFGINPELFKNFFSYENNFYWCTKI